MTIINLQGNIYEFGNDPIEATKNGLFGGEPDDTRVFIPGISWYRINGKSVTREQFWQSVVDELPSAGSSIRRND